MTNPKTDPLDEVEAYLIAMQGAWAAVPSSLRASILNSQADDGRWTKEIQDAIKAERKRLYEEAIRAFAEQCMRLHNRP